MYDSHYTATFICSSVRLLTWSLLSRRALLLNNISFKFCFSWSGRGTSRSLLAAVCFCSNSLISFDEPMVCFFKEIRCKYSLITSLCPYSFIESLLSDASRYAWLNANSAGDIVLARVLFGCLYFWILASMNFLVLRSLSNFLSLLPRVNSLSPEVLFFLLIWGAGLFALVKTSNAFCLF